MAAKTIKIIDLVFFKKLRFYGQNFKLEDSILILTVHYLMIL